MDTSLGINSPRPADNAAAGSKPASGEQLAAKRQGIVGQQQDAQSERSRQQVA
ncbi:MAG: hypothetical protein QM805_00800 [Pseudomonas sp.]